MRIERKPKQILLYLFTIAIIILSISFIFHRQFAFFINAVLVYIGYLIFYYFEKKGSINTTLLVNGSLVFLIILHLVFGQYLELYKTSLYFDKGLHVIGSFIICLFIYQVLISLVGNDLSNKVLVFILISSVGITLGVLLEILEFILDILFKANNQKGLLDTNLDLLLNAGGAFLAGLIIVMKKKDAL